jgi:hypothetical protein
MKKIIALIETGGELKKVGSAPVKDKRLMESITKDELRDAETITLEAKFMDFNEMSTNDRFYNKESFLEEFHRVAKLAEEGKLFCAADHPEDDEEYIVKSGKIAGIIEKLWYVEEEEACYVRLKLIPTIVGGGYDLIVVTKNGGVLSVSLRALGVMDEESKEAFVDSIYTIDVVAMAGMQSAVTRIVDFETGKLMESSKTVLFGGKKRLKENLELDIAKDLKPKIEDIKKKNKTFTVEDLEKLMTAGKADLKMIDGVMSELVGMGVDFDTKLEESELVNMGVGEEVVVKLDSETEAVMELTKTPWKNNEFMRATAELNKGELYDIMFDGENWVLDEDSDDDRLMESMRKKIEARKQRLMEARKKSKLRESRDNHVLKIAKGLDFETKEELYDYIEDSLINGQRQQMRSLFDQLKNHQQEFLDYAKDMGFESYVELKGRLKEECDEPTREEKLRETQRRFKERLKESTNIKNENDALKFFMKSDWSDQIDFNGKLDEDKDSLGDYGYRSWYVGDDVSDDEVSIFLVKDKYSKYQWALDNGYGDFIVGINKSGRLEESKKQRIKEAKFSLVNVSRDNLNGTVNGMWIQDHIGSLESAIEAAKATEKANKGKIDVAVVSQLSGSSPNYNTQTSLKRLDSKRITPLRESRNRGFVRVVTIPSQSNNLKKMLDSAMLSYDKGIHTDGRHDEFSLYYEDSEDKTDIEELLSDFKKKGGSVMKVMGLKESRDGHVLKMAKGLDFETKEELYDYIEDSLINGQRQQMRSLFDQLKNHQQEFLDYAKDMGFESYVELKGRMKENGSTSADTAGRGDFSFGNDPSNGSDVSIGSGENFEDLLKESIEEESQAILQEKVKELMESGMSEEEATLEAENMLENMGVSPRLKESFKETPEIEKIVMDEFRSGNERGMLDRVSTMVGVKAGALDNSGKNIVDQKSYKDIISYVFRKWEEYKKQESDENNYKKLVEALSDDSSVELLERKKAKILESYPMMESYSDEAVFAFDGLDDPQKNELALTDGMLTESELISAIEEYKESKN